MKIYLSSTYEDLKDHRRTVFDALRQSGYQVINMEDYAARDDRPVNTCLKDVAESEIYVGIFGLRYGYVPPAKHGNPDGLSITELEFRKADSQGTTYCMTFLLNEKDALPPGEYVDALSGENEQGARIKGLREYVQSEKTARFFSYAKPHELASLVQRTVAKYVQERGDERPSDDAARPIPSWDVAKNGPPYPGLLHFTRKYTPVFFGREVEVREVLDRLYAPEGRFLIISGNSGTGKSSLVDAGVLPRLEESGLPGSTSCACVRMVPSHGDQPFDALKGALHGAIERAGLNPHEIGKALLQRPHMLPDTLKTIISAGIDRDALVLFLDQMEELFGGESKGKDLAASFLTSLFAATQQNALYVIATVRSDLLHHCYGHSEMLSVLKGPGHYPLGHMAPHALRDLIVKPAQCAGVSVPAPLTKRLIEDAGTEPGNLPLLAFALRRLFERETGDTLSTALYDQWGGEALGGLKGAIAEHADEVERDLCQDEALNLNPDTLGARLADIFPSLVRADLEGLPTRRRAPVADFTAELAPLLQALVNARLLTAEVEGKSSTVSVAHERLFEAWPALERWVAGHQDDLRTLRQGELEAAEWRRQHYDLAHVWPPVRLKPLQTLLERLPTERSSRDVREFARPQPHLIELLKRQALSHEDRHAIGRYLVELGDPRPGTGVSADGIPDIDWVSIKGGRVVLEIDKVEQTVPDFNIARYPVTHIQFQAFVDAEDGYGNAAWWQGMPEEAANGSVAPNWHEPYCPRETVSWYEAVAFCQWLSRHLGFELRLPTEFEWQQAATHGEAERVYPWGAEWDEGRCNSTESRLNRTTVVGLYPHGTWPDGPLDMAGNVDEWCQNKYEKPMDDQIDTSDDMRVVRGGSWVNGSDYCRAAARGSFGGYGDPVLRYYGDGFRLLRPPSPGH